MARRTELVLRRHKVNVEAGDVQAALEEITDADPEQAVMLIMELLSGSGLEPEAFDEVRQLSEGIVVGLEPNTSQRILARCEELFRVHDQEPPAERLEFIRGRTAWAALGLAADLLVEYDLYSTTQAATEALDSDGEFGVASDRR
jgi:hypothetical protein